MSRYVVMENIRRFKGLLAQDLTPDRRRLVEGLLSEEEAKLSSLGAAHVPPSRVARPEAGTAPADQTAQGDADPAG